MVMSAPVRSAANHYLYQLGQQISVSSMNPPFAPILSIAMLFLIAVRDSPAAPPPDIEQCAAIDSDAERLKCYDALTGKNPAVSEPASDAQFPPAPEQTSEATASTALARHWELDDNTKTGTFHLRPHKPNYLLPFRYSTSPNSQPLSPPNGLPPQLAGLDHTEVKFQISSKTKVAENLFSGHADLWIAYTQQSNWQAYAEHPAFRETNYEPEVMMVFRTDYDLLWLKGRFINFGLVHQSNGRGEFLERSWNRVYAQFGFERGDFALLIRPWWRLPENASSDNNPDITSYLGNGDVLAVYKRGEETYSLLLRNNLHIHNNRGAAQLDLSFPIWGRLKGYIQLFSGYGETLIDYNHRQNTIGVGVQLTHWM